MVHPGIVLRKYKTVIIVWECELKNPEKVLARLENLFAAKERMDRENSRHPAAGIKYQEPDTAVLPLAAGEPAEYRAKRRKS